VRSALAAMGGKGPKPGTPRWDRKNEANKARYWRNKEAADKAKEAAEKVALKKRASRYIAAETRQLREQLAKVKATVAKKQAAKTRQLRVKLAKEKAHKVKEQRRRKSAEDEASLLRAPGGRDGFTKPLLVDGLRDR